MNETRSLDQNNTDGISALLTGRRIVAAEQGRFEQPDGHNWGDAITGKLTLDDGTVVWVAPNEGGCACSAGDYYLKSLATCDNIITSVRVVAEEDSAQEWSEPDRSDRIYVVADAVEINAVQIDGNDGNGYYGTGYELIVTVPQSGGDSR
jgi:hypothetical protein